jgi:hypothetical protein
LLSPTLATKTRTWCPEGSQMGQPGDEVRTFRVLAIN